MSHTDEDREMLDYLLDRLPNEERDRTDMRLSADPTYFEQMEAFEEDLIVQWNQGKLAAVDSTRFREVYNTAERQARISAILGLIDTVAGADPATPELPAAGWTWLSPFRHSTRLAIAASLVLVVITAAVALQWSRAEPTDGTLFVALTAVGERGLGPSRAYDTVRLTGESTIDFSIQLAEPVVPGDLVVDISALDRAFNRTYGEPDVLTGPEEHNLRVLVPADDLDDGDYVLTVMRQRVGNADVLRRQAFRVVRE